MIVVVLFQVSSVISNIIIYFEPGCRVNTSGAERRRMETSFKSLTEAQKLASWSILVNLGQFGPFSSILTHFDPFFVHLICSFLLSVCGRLRGTHLKTHHCNYCSSDVFHKIKSEITRLDEMVWKFSLYYPWFQFLYFTSISVEPQLHVHNTLLCEYHNEKSCRIISWVHTTTTIHRHHQQLTRKINLTGVLTPHPHIRQRVLQPKLIASLLILCQLE